MINRTQLAALQTLLNLARGGCSADLSMLAAELGLSCVQADQLLEQLDLAGLVDSDRVRLTMAGLAVAVASKRVRPRQRGPKGHLAA